MNIDYFYGSGVGEAVDGVEALVAKFKVSEFDSPYRSTVPNIAYWSGASAQQRIARLADFAAFPVPTNCKLHFEHETPPEGGSGTASHTDVMLTWEDICVGVEAKFTENLYESVSVWLAKGSNSENRRKVLDGWLGMITRYLRVQIAPDRLSDMTYQVIHRLASVCGQNAKRSVLFYQLFSRPDCDVREHLESYRSELRKLRKVLGETRKLKIILCPVEVLPGARYQELLNQWDRGERKLNSEVAQELRLGRAMEFKDATCELL